MSTYYDRQLADVMTKYGKYVDIKVMSPNGATNWMRINRECLLSLKRFCLEIDRRQAAEK